MSGLTRVVITLGMAVVTLFLTFVWVLRQPQKDSTTQKSTTTQEATAQQPVASTVSEPPVAQVAPEASVEHSAPVVVEQETTAQVFDDVSVDQTSVKVEEVASPQSVDVPSEPPVVHDGVYHQPKRTHVSLHRWLADRQNGLPLPQYTPEVVYPVFNQPETDHTQTPAAMTQKQFFDVFFSAAGMPLDAAFVTRESRTASVPGMARELVMFYKLATHRFPDTMPRAFVVHSDMIPLVVVPHSPQVNVLLYEKDGHIKVLFPQVDSSLVKGKQTTVLFEPYDFQPADQTTFVSPEVKMIHGFLREKCKELLAVREGKLDPVVTYLSGGNELELREVPGKLKQFDFTKELALFDQLYDQATNKPYGFYSRNLTSLYSAVMHMPIQKGKIYRFEYKNATSPTAEYDKFVVFSSGLSGYNIILGRRKTDKYEYVQLVCPDFPSNIVDIVAGGQRPFLKPRTALLSMDDERNHNRFKKLAADTGITLSFVS